MAADGTALEVRRGALRGAFFPSLWSRLFPQPLFAIGVAAVAMAAIAGAAGQSAPRLDRIGSETIWSAVVMAGLTAALGASIKFPVHVQRGTKFGMGSTVLFLIAVLLSPLNAVLAAGIGVATGGFLVRGERGTYLSDIATDAGRWIVVVAGGSILAHGGWAGAAPSWLAVPMTLSATALVLWAGDLATAPLLIWPMTRQPPWRLVVAIVRASGLIEVSQYLVGMLGAVAAMQQRWTLLMLLVPIVPLYRAARTVRETSDSTRQVLESMADAVDLRDPYTGGHSQRVAGYVASILDAMNILGTEAELIASAARVHDIGKIGTPDHVLLKEGPLTPEERRLMEQHSVLGASLLLRYPDFARGTDIVRHHHERWDGNGYPDRLKGDAIPFGARVIAAADSFDAMTSDRPYRKGMPGERAMAILREGRGTQWDPEVVDAFLRCS